jgi:hypothetical protein
MRWVSVVLIVACAPARPGRPCPAPPPPSAEAFSACGGMLYHTPPGDAVRYTIKFANKMSNQYQLIDLCILLDEAPLFTAKDIEASPKDVKWDGRLSHAHHRVQVQATYRVKIAPAPFVDVKPAMISVRAVRDIAALDGGSLDITAFEQGGPTTPIEKRPALKMAHPNDTPEPKCEH